jgi:hypothetical protein
MGRLTPGAIIVDGIDAIDASLPSVMMMTNAISVVQKCSLNMIVILLY